MKLIIGSYRGPEMVRRALHSIVANLTGWTELVIVDDSGKPEWVREYQDIRVMFPDGRIRGPWVFSLPRVGYTPAMKAICRVAGDEPFMLWEEDFILTEKVDLGEMLEVLEERPYLAQLALLRQPVFRIEREHGGLLEGMKARLPDITIETVDGIIEQTGTFTCNPAVWQAGIASRGWPNGQWSEDTMRAELLADGYRFGFLPGVRVKHDGKRLGFGY